MFTERRTEPYTQRKCDGRTGASATLPVGPLTGENSTSPLTCAKHAHFPGRGGAQAGRSEESYAVILPNRMNQRPALMPVGQSAAEVPEAPFGAVVARQLSEEHTSELQSHHDL